MFNALFALSALGLMASGYLRDHEGRVNLSIGLIALYIITRYFEYSIDLLDSSLMFFGAGVILLAGGYLLDRILGYIDAYVDRFLLRWNLLPFYLRLQIVILIWR